MHFLSNIDIDECVLGQHLCHMFANCTDVEGSYNCSCLDGFYGDGFNCTGNNSHCSLIHHTNHLASSSSYVVYLYVSDVELIELHHSLYRY